MAVLIPRHGCKKHNIAPSDGAAAQNLTNHRFSVKTVGKGINYKELCARLLINKAILYCRLYSSFPICTERMWVDGICMIVTTASTHDQVNGIKPKGK